jgi:hypothetical protein
LIQGEVAQAMLLKQIEKGNDFILLIKRIMAELFGKLLLE